MKEIDPNTETTILLMYECYRRGHQVFFLEFHDLYIREGNDHYGRRSFQDNELAKDHYRRAIELDPGFARAYSALALAYSRDAVDGWEPSARGAMERASALIDQASGSALPRGQTLPRMMPLSPTTSTLSFIVYQVSLSQGKSTFLAMRRTDDQLRI